MWRVPLHLYSPDYGEETEGDAHRGRPHTGGQPPLEVQRARHVRGEARHREDHGSDRRSDSPRTPGEARGQHEECHQPHVSRILQRLRRLAREFARRSADISRHRPHRHGEEGDQLPRDAEEVIRCRGISPTRNPSKDPHGGAACRSPLGDGTLGEVTQNRLVMTIARPERRFK
jgi:hypothetical protein